jgi:hypothetical protein
VAKAIVEPVPGLNESKAKFVVISNVLGGIRDYDCGSWLEPEAHEDVAMAVMQQGRKLNLPRPLNGGRWTPLTYCMANGVGRSGK